MFRVRIACGASTLTVVFPNRVVVVLLPWIVRLFVPLRVISLPASTRALLSVLAAVDVR